MIGDILVLKNEVDDPEKLLEIPGVNRIVKLGHIRGLKREPQVKMIWGEGTETIHRENHCFYKLDVAKIMWSKGNTMERKRIADLVEDQEVVIDLFAGIGYFTIPIAVHSSPKKIYALEINPLAYNYLLENIKINNVEDVVEPILGDSKHLAPQGIADRVLMGYIGQTHKFLPVAINALKEEGGIIHYHETVPEKLMFSRPIKRIEKAANQRKVEIIQKRAIKKYSPGVFHVVVDAKVK